jgi:uncharacterized protein with HEPN domain
MSSLFDKEAHYIGDIAEEADRALSFAGDIMTLVRDLDLLRLYAVEKAIQNVAEACIKMEDVQQSGRFEAFFPDFKLKDIRLMGNLIRHDYGNIDVHAVVGTLEDQIPRLKARAEELLAAHRRLHGDLD